MSNLLRKKRNKTYLQIRQETLLDLEEPLITGTRDLKLTDKNIFSKHDFPTFMQDLKKNDKNKQISERINLLEKKHFVSNAIGESDESDLTFW